MSETTEQPQPVPGDDAVVGVPEEKPAGLSRSTRAIIDWILVVGIALLVAIVVRTFVLAHFVVDGTSMYSTLDTGDRVFVNKLSYRLHDPNRGDVVVLHQISGHSERDLIKRVIALPGETIAFDGPADFDSWDRCVTRGMPSSMMPYRYNGGFSIRQAPGYVIFDLEMIHESRVIPTDGRAPLP